MFTRINVFFVISTFFCAIPSVLSACRQSFIIECDSIQDLYTFNKEAEDFTDWTVLKVGNEKSPTLKPVNLKDIISPQYFSYTEVVIIVGEISELQFKPDVRCHYVTPTLKVLSFYKNNFNELKRQAFPNFTLKKLLLVDNNIQRIGPAALSSQEVEILDLSFNKLEDLEARTLPDAKIIKINHNRLTHIEPDSFESSLEQLSLNYNNLRYIQPEVFEKLSNLKVLQLKHNRFSNVPNIIDLPSIIYFDMKYNALRSLKAIEIPNSLRRLDFAYNNISSADGFFNVLLKRKNENNLAVSLLFNQLQWIEAEGFGEVNGVTLYLYGNPWSCNFWNKNQAKLIRLQSNCDLDLFNNGPFCIDYKGIETDAGLEAVTIFSQKFEDLIHKNGYAGGCHLYFKNTNVYFGCVKI